MNGVIGMLVKQPALDAEDLRGAGDVQINTNNTEKEHAHLDFKPHAHQWLILGRNTRRRGYVTYQNAQVCKLFWAVFR